MVFGLSWLSGIGLVGFGKRLVRLDPHPRIKSGAGSSPVSPSGRGDGR